MLCQKKSSCLFFAVSILFLSSCRLPFQEDLYSLVARKARFLPEVDLQPKAAPYYQFAASPVPIITITCSQADARVFYSLEGSSDYTLYTEPFVLPLPDIYTSNRNITVRSYAAHPEFENSPEKSETYSFLLSGSMVTLAGRDAPGFSGDGDPAYTASLDSPEGIVLDAAGNIYIADTGNHRIRKIDNLTGRMSTIAGSGTAGFGGDGGLATEAQLSSPSDICINNTDLYIADSGNNRIRVMNFATRNITTYAGTGAAGFGGDSGLAANAQFDNPCGITFDNNEKNLFIADTGNNCIRKIVLTTSTITTAAGTGGSGGFSGDGGLAASALLSAPRGASIKLANKDLYIADTGNNRVRLVNGTTGIITTFAGTGAAEFSGDGGPAVSAGLDSPAKVFLGASGELYIADSGNSRIRLVSAGTITTMPNTGPDQLAVQAGIYQTALLPNAGMYIADTGNDRIRKILNY